MYENNTEMYRLWIFCNWFKPSGQPHTKILMCIFSYIPWAMIFGVGVGENPPVVLTRLWPWNLLSLIHKMNHCLKIKWTSQTLWVRTVIPNLVRAGGPRHEAAGCWWEPAGATSLGITILPHGVWVLRIVCSEQQDFKTAGSSFKRHLST